MLERTARSSVDPDAIVTGHYPGSRTPSARNDPWTQTSRPCHPQCGRRVDRLKVHAEPPTTMGAMPSNAAMRKPKQVSELERARTLGLVGAVKDGPRDVAERHSRYLGAKLRRRARRIR